MYACLYVDFVPAGQIRPDMHARTQFVVSGQWCIKLRRWGSANHRRHVGGQRLSTLARRLIRACILTTQVHNATRSRKCQGTGRGVAPKRRRCTRGHGGLQGKAKVKKESMPLSYQSSNASNAKAKENPESTAECFTVPIGIVSLTTCNTPPSIDGRGTHNSLQCLTRLLSHCSNNLTSEAH